MTDIAFDSLSKEQLLDGFIHCRKSADIHFHTSSLVASKGYYGMANSHLILGVEEGVKAFLILSSYLNIDSGIDSIEPYFKYHTKKLIEGKKIASLYNKIIPAFEIGFSLVKGNIIGVIGGAIRFSNSKVNFDWWDKANDTKNLGFYVDFRSDAWVCPETFTKEQYSKSQREIRSIEGFLKLTRKITKSELEELLNTILDLDLINHQVNEEF